MKRAQFMQAITDNQIETLQTLINDKQIWTYDKGEGLQHAAFLGREEAVVCLLKYGNILPYHINGAILWAAENGHTAIVQRLLQEKCLTPEYKRKAFTLAIIHDHIPVIAILLKDPKIKVADRGEGFMQAVYSANKKTVEYLYDPQLFLCHKNEALQLAQDIGRNTLANALLKKDAELYNHYYPPQPEDIITSTENSVQAYTPYADTISISKECCLTKEIVLSNPENIEVKNLIAYNKNH